MARQDNTVTVENARIIFRNFAGRETMYNREGDRNFVLVLPEDIAVQMLEDGWNVKKKDPRDEGDPNEWHLQVSVGYKGRPPRIVMITSRGRTELGEDEVELLDWSEFRNVDLIVRPYNWEVSGKSGIKAYLKSMFVTIEEDELERKYADVQDANSSLPED